MAQEAVLVFPVQDLRKLVMTIDGEFPILEYLIMEPSLKENTALILPETLKHQIYTTLRWTDLPVQYDLGYTRLPRTSSHTVLW